MIRLGHCCIFRDQPIKFTRTTATSVGRMDRADALAKLGRLCMTNAEMLLASLRFCASNGIGCFRINSQILPLKTHPQHRYGIEDLPEGDQIVRRFQECGAFARQSHLRTCFHPDQFVVLNSLRPDGVTIVVLMGFERRAALGAQLLSAGWNAQTPAAIVADGTRAGQEVWRGTLQALADDAAVINGGGPALIVIGAVAALDLNATFSPQVGEIADATSDLRAQRSR